MSENYYGVWWSKDLSLEGGWVTLEGRVIVSEDSENEELKYIASHMTNRGVHAEIRTLPVPLTTTSTESS